MEPSFMTAEGMTVVGILVAIIGSGMRGIWEFSFQHRREIAAKNEQIIRLETQLKEQREDYEKRLAREVEEKNEFKGFTLQLLDLHERTTAVAEKTIERT